MRRWSLVTAHAPVSCRPPETALQTASCNALTCTDASSSANFDTNSTDQQVPGRLHRSYVGCASSHVPGWRLEHVPAHLHGAPLDKVLDHPRVDGSTSPLSALCVILNGSSPRARGATIVLSEPVVRLGIIPAYTRSTSHGPSVSWYSCGSSPHTRGALRLALAPGRRRADHPRIHREDDCRCARGLQPYGSSPRIRGAPVCPAGPREDGRIIPAYTGSTSRSSTSGKTTTDHLRIHGEHWSYLGQPAVLEGSSLHTRGALRHHAQRPAVLRITPAYTGST